jgi:CDP-glucose 4,6-dehydratase
VILNEAVNEIRKQTLNPGKARQKLGWRPLFSLDEGLDRTIAWYREFLLDPGRS